MRPRTRLEDAIAAVVERERRFDRGLPGRHVLARQHAAVRTPAHVHHVGLAAEAVDRVRNEPLAPDARGPRKLRLAPAAARLGLLEKAHVGFSERAVDEEAAGRGHAASAQVEIGRGRPVLLEQALDGGDRGRRALDDGMAVQGVRDGGLQHVPQAQRAEFGEHMHIGLERARNARGQQARARHDVEAQVPAVVRDRGARWCGSLPADDLRLVAAGLAVHHGDIAAGAAQVRLHYLQREGRGDAGVEGVAAPFQDAHADRRADPVRRGDDAERAVDLGPRREGTGVYVRHGLPLREGLSAFARHVGIGLVCQL